MTPKPQSTTDGQIVPQGVEQAFLSDVHPMAGFALSSVSPTDTPCAKQLRITLRNCGLDPESIEEYVARRGYQALSKALTTMTPSQVIDEVKRSGLRCRNGSGSLVGLKWGFTQKGPGEIKYILCSADEGDPWAFVGHSILESDPHSVIEVMVIAAYAVAAHQGYACCRAEYPLAAQPLDQAIQQAGTRGLLGQDILGTGFGFNIRVRQSPGAFVAGEETALSHFRDEFVAHIVNKICPAGACRDLEETPRVGIPAHHKQLG